MSIEKSIIEKSRELIGAADAVLISAGAGLSVPAGINYHDTKKFAAMFPALVRKGYRIQYELIGHSHVDPRRGWTPAVKWGYLAPHINYVYYETGKDKTYEQLYSLIQARDYFVMTTNVDGLFVQNGFSENRIYTPQGSFSRIQCMKRCTEETWDAKPVIDKIIPVIDPQTQEVTDSSVIPTCPRCGGDMFMNVRGGNWFVHKPYEEQSRALNDWAASVMDKQLVVLDLGTGFNTPGVVRFPAENIVSQHQKSNLIRVNLDHPEVPEAIMDKSISISGDVSGFVNDVFVLGDK